LCMVERKEQAKIADVGGDRTSEEKHEKISKTTDFDDTVTPKHLCHLKTPSENI